MSSSPRAGPGRRSASGSSGFASSTATGCRRACAPPRIRNLVLGGQWLVGIVVAYSPCSGRVFSNPWLWFSLALVVGLAQLAVWIEIAIKAYRRSPGLHDRLAGTRVVYLPPHAEDGVG